ncbi:MAG: sensor histidine kinase [Bacteroidota bacterium]
MRTLFEWIKWGGLIGIGISMMFFLTFEGSISVRLLLYYLLFGLIAGIIITLGNWFLTETIYRSAPSKLFMLAQLIVRYVVSAVLFYFTASFYRSFIYDFFPNHQIVMGTSLAVGVASVMVGLFWCYTAEKDERIKLEIENRKLAVIEERNRIARELHDSVSQNLFGISLNLNTLQYFWEREPEKAKEIIAGLREMVAEVQTEMGLMIFELQPVTLNEKGFFEALENMAKLFRGRYNLDIDCYFSGDEGEVDEKRRLVIYRVLQESLHNIVRHAKAEKVRVNLKIESGHGYLSVQDDGKGFELTELDNKGHLGVRGMSRRVAEAGGDFKIESAPGEGTTVSAYV